ncbi:MAG: hypothetical protein WKG07_31920 [Hymenobacter sp.]
MEQAQQDPPGLFGRALRAAAFPARKHDHFLIPARYHPLLRARQHGAGDFGYALHFHLQALGLEPPGLWTAGPGRSTLAHGATIFSPSAPPLG